MHLFISFPFYNLKDYLSRIWSWRFIIKPCQSKSFLKEQKLGKSTAESEVYFTLVIWSLFAHLGKSKIFPPLFSVVVLSLPVYSEHQPMPKIFIMIMTCSVGGLGYNATLILFSCSCVHIVLFLDCVNNVIRNLVKSLLYTLYSPCVR